MRLHQREVALLISDDSLLQIAPALKIFWWENESFFIQHLTFFLHMMSFQLRQKWLNISVNFESTYLLDAYLKPNLT